MSELKNCPFCGGEAETKMYRWGEKQNGEAIWCYYIFCTNCQSVSDNLFTDKGCAIAAWNTRTASPRFTEVERGAMITLSDYSECSNLDGCEGCSKEIHMGVCKYYVTDGKLIDAIASVRSMLTASEIADKGKG